MTVSLFEGELVRLAAGNAETDTEAIARWSRDSEYLRLLDSDPARPFTLQDAREELNRDAHSDAFHFVIRTRADDRLIGFVGIFAIRWTHGDGTIGIGLGEREYWGRGYGTEAMRLVVRFAFQELNLHRVSLSVFEYNTRARRSYEKVGFRFEGQERQVLLRDGRRYDEIYMGLLRREWETHLQGEQAAKQGIGEVASDVVQ